jgi:uracil-DNA glycosylase
MSYTAVPLSPHDQDTTPFWDMLNVPVDGLLWARHSLIRKNILNCQSCLSSQLTKPLSLHNESARIVVVGERPDDMMLETPSGKALSELLNRSQLPLKEVYLTAVSKCIEAADARQCHHHLVAELLTLRPSLVVALGYNTALALTPQPSAGTYVPLFSNITLLPTYSLQDAMADESGQITHYLTGQFTYIAQQIRGMTA